MPFFEDIAVGIAKNLTISAARPLLLALLGAQDDQLKKLSTIQQDVRRLLEGPWRQARVLVAEAAETRDDDPQRMVYLDEARQALFLAYGYQPDVHPARAAIAAELAMVIGLLGRRDDCQRWAATAHDEAVCVVIEAIPPVQSAVNRREWLPLVERVRRWDFMWGASEPTRKSFWGAATKTFAGGDEMAYLVTQPHLRAALERFYEERLPLPDRSDEAAADLGLDTSRPDDKLFLVALREQLSTVPSHQLRGLYRSASEAEEYRRICVVLQPHLDLPRHWLRLNLSEPFHAKITWERAS
jgi:hypothetical protein